MSPRRWTLVALLVASTALFAVAVIVERSNSDTHTEPTSAHVGEAGEVPAGEHAEGGEGHDETTAGDAHTATNEAVLGVNIESTPLIVLAVIFGLALAALAAAPFGGLPAVLLAVALIALAWAALDVREVVHQLDESRTGIALLAIIVAVLHLATAQLAGRIAVRARQQMQTL
jgi:hypothetical protein